ncbi:MAG: arginine--tRNA ligase [Armatimonadetes bacterium]|nr:arginine--tRNA ligase [Armatimonadota bacterium]
MLRSELTAKVDAVIEGLKADGSLPGAEYPKAEISDTKSPEHGDFACNFAMAAAKTARMNPRALGEMIAGALSHDADLSKVEVAGPGFINLTLSERMTARALDFVLSGGASFFHRAAAKPLKINVEFVSVNPNGPITVGSGRGAAYGSTLCNVLEAVGHTVHREYYINDGINSEQMRLFALSVKALSEGKKVPDDGYKGDYVQEVSASLSDQYDVCDLSLGEFQTHSQRLMIDSQRGDLQAFGVEFDTWFSEQSLHDSGAVDDGIRNLLKKKVADEQTFRTKVAVGKNDEIKDVTREPQNGDEQAPSPLGEDEGGGAEGKPDTLSPTLSHRRGSSSDPTASVESDASQESGDSQESGEANSPGTATLWLRSTKFGDDMDRVLRRSDGRLTYIASDIAYHKDKFNRPEGCDKLITVLGPDHHGYISRLHAVVAAMLMQPSPAKSETFDEHDAMIWSDKSEKQDCLDARDEANQKLDVLIFQLVRFLKDGVAAPMRKRDGNIYALIDLINEIGEHVQPDGSDEDKQRVGRDVARFFYLMRHHDTTFDFDLDLAEKQSDENPVFYVQYAHARICSLIAKAAEAGIKSPLLHSCDSEMEEGVRGGGPNLELLRDPKEKALILKLQDLGYEVERCAEDYAVNRLTTYATELARTYHHFYDACRVIQPEEPELSQARLALCQATATGLKAVFGLLGISAPKRMDR